MNPLRRFVQQSRLEATNLAKIAYSVTNWMGVLKARLYGDLAEILDPLWNAILSALRGKLSDEATQRSEGWASVALNSPVGRLVEVLLADPSLPNPADGTGLPGVWKQRAEPLLALPGDLRCHALVMLGHHFVYLYAADPQWVEVQLVPFANSQTETADALWDLAAVSPNGCSDRVATSAIPHCRQSASRPLSAPTWPLRCTRLE